MTAALDERIGILLVDDRPELSYVLGRVLAASGREIVTVTSGREALRQLLIRDFAVIVLDVRMPEMDGFELATLIRRRQRTSSTPILFLTGESADMSSIYRAYAIGAVDYLTKPVDPDILRGKVNVFVELFEKDRRLHRQAGALLDAERRNRELEIEQVKLSNARRYRHLADAIPDIMWTTDRQGHCTYFNRRWTEYTGTPDVESWTSAVHPNEREACDRAWINALAKGLAFEDEHRLRGADGSFRWHLCRALPEYDVEGEISGWLGTHTDLDDLVRARSQAEAARQRSDFLAAAGAVLASLDTAQSIRELVGLLVPQIAEACLVELEEDDDPDAPPARARVALHADAEKTARLEGLLDGVALASGSGELMADVGPAWRASGLSAEVDLASELGVRSAIIVPIATRGRTFGRLTLLGRADAPPYDLGDLAMALELGRRAASAIENALLYRKAERAIRARDEFLSVASHELRTPLSALVLQLGSLELASHGNGNGNGETNGRTPKKIEAALRQTRRLTKLVDNLLDVSRLSARRLSLELETCDLSAIVRDVVERFEEQATASGCELHMQASEPTPGEWDRSRIEQVVTNLLSNAIKYGQGRPIDVLVESQPRAIHLSISDRGIGIAHEDQSRIFERFERAVSIRHYGGLGLGLYIARQIVEAHGGTVRVQSLAGSGSTFTVELPRRPPAIAADRAAPRS